MEQGIIAGPTVAATPDAADAQVPSPSRRRHNLNTVAMRRAMGPVVSPGLRIISAMGFNHRTRPLAASSTSGQNAQQGTKANAPQQTDHESLPGHPHANGIQSGKQLAENRRADQDFKIGRQSESKPEPESEPREQQGDKGPAQPQPQPRKHAQINEQAPAQDLDHAAHSIEDGSFAGGDTETVHQYILVDETKNNNTIEITPPLSTNNESKRHIEHIVTASVSAPVIPDALPTRLPGKTSQHCSSPGSIPKTHTSPAPGPSCNTTDAPQAVKDVLAEGKQKQEKKQKPKQKSKQRQKQKTESESETESEHDHGTGSGAGAGASSSKPIEDPLDLSAVRDMDDREFKQLLRSVVQAHHRVLNQAKQKAEHLARAPTTSEKSSESGSEWSPFEVICESYVDSDEESNNEAQGTGKTTAKTASTSGSITGTSTTDAAPIVEEPEPEQGDDQQEDDQQESEQQERGNEEPKIEEPKIEEPKNEEPKNEEHEEKDQSGTPTTTLNLTAIPTVPAIPAIPAIPTRARPPAGHYRPDGLFLPAESSLLTHRPPPPLPPPVPNNMQHVHTHTHAHNYARPLPHPHSLPHAPMYHAFPPHPVQPHMRPPPPPPPHHWVPPSELVIPAQQLPPWQPHGYWEGEQ